MPAAVDTVLTAAGAEQASTTDAAAGRDVTHSRMRRVASAPAFKHPSCYREVSPTAAVAAAAAAAADAPARASGTRSGMQRLHAPQPCSSCSGGRCNCLEVYVVSRSFTEFGGPVMKRLQPEAKEQLVDLGICHYMTVFKTADGQMVQFDFGPLGGDVQKAHGPLAAFLRRARAASQKQQAQDAASAAAAVAVAAAAAASSSHGGPAIEQPAGSSGRGMVHSPSAPSLPMASLDLAAYGGGEALVSFVDSASTNNRPKRGVAGEIRERELQQLPPACMYMGRTSLTLDDIRQYNAAQGGRTYTLHENDCRHYVNSLVQYATGVERSTQHLKRHYFQSRHADKWLWYGWWVSAAQLMTDVGNWSHIQAGAAVTLLAVTGRSTLASLKTLATPVLPALKGLPALLPSAGLAAAGAGAAAAAAPGTAAAAAATAGPSGTVIGVLATTLKLPAAMLLKRPLAAGAAAGGAGAAAAVVRDATGTAAAGPSSGGSGGAAGAPGRAWGAVGRPLQAVGDGMAHGVRSAVLGLRKLAVGNNRALQQLHHEPLMVSEQDLAAAASAAGSRGAFWGRRSSVATGDQLPRKWFGFRKPSNGQVVVPAAAAAVVGGGVEQQQQHVGQEQEHEQQRLQRRPLAQLGQSVGRHVVWLGSAAARASGQLALFAFGGSRVAQYAAPAPAAPAVAVGEGSYRGEMMHSASSQQLQIVQQQQTVCAAGMGNRSLSMPSLLAAAPAAGSADACAPGRVSFSVSSSGHGRDGSSSCGGTPLTPLGGGDLLFMWDSGGSSSITSSSFGSKSAGVGRQTLNLPTPRISWGKRATQAMIVRQ